MFAAQLEMVREHIRQLVLHPPLAPGGMGRAAFDTAFQSGASADSGAEDDLQALLGEVAVDANNKSEPFLLRYLPLALLLTLFWPVLLTLVAASVSASAWLFWLCVGAAFGVLQLLFVLYNFLMIVWDLCVLTLLKTFAMLRSFVRYYTYKAGKRGDHGAAGKLRRKRRRKEWREELDRATTFQHYCQIEILEPASSPPTASAAKVKSRTLKRHTTSHLASSPAATRLSSPKTYSPMRKTLSCVSFRKKENDGADLTPKAANVAANPNHARDVSKQTNSSFPRNFSYNSLPKKSSFGEFDDQQSSSSSSCPKWQTVVKEDLGMAGRMLLTTLARLKEARLQASNMENAFNTSQTAARGTVDHTDYVNSRENGMTTKTDANDIDNDVNDDNSELSLSSHNSSPSQPDDTANSTPQDNPHSNINSTQSSSSSRKQRRKSSIHEDYQSSLKFLLSGIVKRNHLSVDDFLINDARSVAERGQHALRKEAREAIEQYGEELERCLDWLANGAVWFRDRAVCTGMGGDETSLLEHQDSSTIQQQQQQQKQQPQHPLEQQSQQEQSQPTNTLTDSTATAPTSNVTTVFHNNLDTNSNSATTKPPTSNLTSQTMSPEEIIHRQQLELSKRYTLVKRMKQNMGHTALMLSGGGAQAMYHLGTIKALVESELYQDIHVISGTSGGSITAAMCAIKSPTELLRDICVKTVSTDYLLTGQMKRENIRWFPKLVDMGAYWLKHRLMVDSAEFKRCCDFYYGDITFEEAFEMTRKHVCITVSASRASAGSGVQRLLLNHISTPNVTLSSAVAASCALPGVMAPAKLMIKDSRGKQVPFEVDGVEWIDGSVQADLPFKRISTLFNISNYVVAQTNFHVVPFLNKAHHPNINTLYWKLFQMCMWDVRSRVLNLSQLGLFPRIFGQDVTKVFKQKYYGNLTLVPRFTTLQLFGLKSLVNPTVSDMEIYLQNGQIAAWPFLGVMREMLRTEHAIDACLTKLQHRLQSGSGLPLSNTNEDVDSLSSAVGTTYRARLPGLGREAELLKEKVQDLEQENAQLKKQVMRLQRALGVRPHLNNGITATMRSTFDSTDGSEIARSTTLEGKFVSVERVEENEMENDPACLETEEADTTCLEEKKIV